ncbi:MAG: hypothetical protein HS117_10120 [Verrucomicrobiaceae bacterium]|nr:hypothetical protein [Verrucomicrobiaceae bacterium]
MKPFLTIIALAVTSVLAHAQGINPPQEITLPPDIDVTVVKDTGKQAITEVLAAFAANKAASGSQSYIILPLGSDIDQGYFTLQFENAFTQKAGAAGFKLYTRTDKTLEKVLTEIGFQQNFADSLDKGTMQKLALVGAQAVVLPRIDLDRGVDGAVTLRASISVHNVATGEKTWGDEVTKPVPGKLTTEQWVMYGAIALGALGVLVVLIWFALAVRKAARPR